MNNVFKFIILYIYIIYYYFHNVLLLTANFFFYSLLSDFIHDHWNHKWVWRASSSSKWWSGCVKKRGLAINSRYCAAHFICFHSDCWCWSILWQVDKSSAHFLISMIFWSSYYLKLNIISFDFMLQWKIWSLWTVGGSRNRRSCKWRNVEWSVVSQG